MPGPIHHSTLYLYQRSKAGYISEGSKNKSRSKCLDRTDEFCLFRDNGYKGPIVFKGNCYKGTIVFRDNCYKGTIVFRDNGYKGTMFLEKTVIKEL